jgi:hypothetical protein
MPCVDDHRDRDRDSGREIELLTRVACNLAHVLRTPGGTVGDLAVETKAWIRRHDAWDARRIAEEKADAERKRARQKLISKLSAEERRILDC